MADNVPVEVSVAPAVIQRGVLATLADKLDPSQPFALPEGTVRGFLAIAGLGGLLACYLRFQWAPDALVATVSTMVGFYFGARPSK